MVVDLSGSTGDLEYMGIFGFSWEEKVAVFMKKVLKGTAVLKKLTSFFQAGGLNVSLVKNMHNEYMALMATGSRPSGFSESPDESGLDGVFDASTISLASKISNKTNIDASIVLAFLRSLFVLSRDGKIPFAKWNPQGYKESTNLRKSFASEKGFLDTATKAFNTSKVLLLVAGLGVGAYFLSQLKTFRP